MFENEIKFISDFILNKTKDLGLLFTVEKFLLTDIHPAIKKYVESEINYLIYQDRKKLIENSLFDYSGAKISNYFNLIADEIKKTKMLSYEDVKTIILQAVSFNANFVVRPKWTLSKLIFGSNKSVSLNDLQLIFNYTYYYEYLNNVFIAYMTKKKIMNISTTEFELIMNKIDRELFTLHQSKLVDNALYAMADFFNIGGLSKSTVTVEAVEGFLKEKNLTELLFKLKRGFSNALKKKIDTDDIRKVLYSAFPIDSTFSGEENKNVDENEKHFDNPLEDVIKTEGQGKNNQDLSGKVENKASDSASNVDDIFEEEVDDNIAEEKGFDDLYGSGPNEENLDLDLKEVNDEVINEKSAEQIETEYEENKPELTEDEKILDEFTRDVVKGQEDEIIILDDKSEDLLDFYEDETEISIDNEEGSKDNSKKSEPNENIPTAEDNNFNDLLDIEEDPGIQQEAEIEEKNKDSEIIEIEQVNVAENEDRKSDEEVSAEKDQTKQNDRKHFDDIFSFLTKKEIDRLIKNVFNSDSEDFANTIERMSSCNSLEEANEVLQELFKYVRIKTHSKDASALSRAVEKYFNQGK